MSFRRVIALVLALNANAAMTQEAKPATPSSVAPTAAATAGARSAASSAATAAPVVASKPGSPAAGQGKAATCIACHGLDGNSTDPQYPKLAGQHETYIVHQLENFKSGERKNPIMLGFATMLSEQDMHDVGAYFASKSSLPGASDRTQAAPGEKLYREGDAARGIPACMACHSIDGRGNPGALYPQLAGQHAQYVEARLKTYHDDAPSDLPTVKIMQTVAAKLDDKDIAAVASYVEGLPAANGGARASSSLPTTGAR